MAFDVWLGDLRSAVRRALARPAFSALVIATLGIGFGVAGGVLAIVNAALLHPVPYRDASRLVFVWQTLASQNVLELEATPADYTAWGRVAAFSSLAMLASDTYTLTGDGDAERLRGTRMTATLMPLAGIAPRIGRAFDTSEDSSEAAPVAIVSDGLWRRRYGSDPALVGRTIDIDGRPHRVIGVMPPGAEPPGASARGTDLWLPMRMTPDERANAISHNYVLVARLSDGVSAGTANAQVTASAAAMAADQPSDRGLGARVVPLTEDAVRSVKPALLALSMGVALLVVIAAANAATLLVVRATDRVHDASVRAALGATRFRLLSLAVGEALALSAVAGIIAVAIADQSAAAIAPMFGNAMPTTAAGGLSAQAGALTFAATLLVGGAIGLLAGWRGVARAGVDVLRSGTRSSASPPVAHTRAALVVAQVALAVVLLAVAGLLTRSVAHLRRVDAGFSPDGVMTLRLSLDRSTYASAEARSAFVAELERRLHASSAIRDVAVTSHLPLGGTRGANGVDIEGHPAAPGRPNIIDQRHVTPDYFRALGIRVVRGRAFTPTDDARAEPVAMLNRTAAERYFAGADPIGARVRVQAGFDAGTWFRIIGLVDDVRHVALTRAPVAEMYRPFAQAAVPTFAVVIKTTGPPAGAVPTVRSAVRDLDPAVPVYDVRTMADRVASSFAQLRATMLLLGATAVLAAALAAIAIYGSIWYVVAQQIPEIALRLALGAQPVRVCAAVLGGALRLAAAGLAIGLVAAAPAAALLGGQLFETRTTDPATYAAVAVAMVILTAGAGLVPARRAMRVDPIVALRST